MKSDLKKPTAFQLNSKKDRKVMNNQVKLTQTTVALKKRNHVSYHLEIYVLLLLIYCSCFTFVINSRRDLKSSTLPPLVKSNRAEEEVEMRKKTVNLTVPSPAPLVKSNRARRSLESTKTRANHLLQATSLKKRSAGETKELFQITANPTSQPMPTHSLQTFKKIQK